MAALVILVGCAGLVGCGSHAPPCEKVADHATTFVEGLAGASVQPDPKVALRDVVLARCRDDRWSDEVRACLAAATRDGIPACRDKMTVEQAAGLMRDIANIMRSLEVSVTVKRQDAGSTGDKIDVTTDEVPAGSVVIVVRQGAIEVGGKPIAEGDLGSLMRAIYERDHAAQVVVQAVPGTPHGDVVRVLEAAKAAGLTRLAIGTAKSP